MDPNLPAQNTPFYKNKITIVLIIILFQVFYTFTLLNIVKIKQLNQKTSPANLPSQKTINENGLPIALDLLKNPVVDQWGGSVEGLLTAKDEQSITVYNKNKNARITIYLYIPPSKERMTIFYNPKLAKFGKSNPEVDPKDIPVGTYLRGNFFISPLSTDKNKVVGNSFTIVEE